MSREKTHFAVGDQVQRLNGEVVRIIDVQPIGFHVIYTTADADGRTRKIDGRLLRPAPTEATP